MLICFLAITSSSAFWAWAGAPSSSGSWAARARLRLAELEQTPGCKRWEVGDGALRHGGQHSGTGRGGAGRADGARLAGGIKGRRTTAGQRAITTGPCGERVLRRWDGWPEGAVRSGVLARCAMVPAERLLRRLGPSDGPPASVRVAPFQGHRAVLRCGGRFSPARCGGGLPVFDAVDAVGRRIAQHTELA